MLETNITDKIILVTGATSGIGRAVAERFASEGAKVIAIGRNRDQLAALEQSFPDRVYSYAYDLLDLDHMEEIFSFCKENSLKLDGLVHCAGVAFNSVIRTNNIEEMEETMRINCFAFMELGKYFSMKKYSNDGGALVAISSVEALKNEKGLSQYAASKAALNSVIKTMSKEFMRRKLRVNAILPANVKTPMMENTARQIENYMEMAEARQPFGLIEPEYIGYMAEYLLSDLARFMTGELVVMSGGLEY